MKSKGRKNKAKKNPKTKKSKIQITFIAGFLLASMLTLLLAVTYVYGRNSNYLLVSQEPGEIYPEPLPEIPDQEKEPSRGTLIFVIDDAGNNLWELEPFLHFQGPLTIAVLPGLPDSVEAARRIREAGKELFLHQPMESIYGHLSGPGAILAGMEETEVRDIINRNLEEIWPVAGMNNHEGSRVSMDEDTMEIVLDVCREWGIIFLDSRTTAETKAPEAASRLGIQIGERDVFLDNEQDRDSIIRQIERGLMIAEQKGNAIMIGHAFTPVLGPLMEELYVSWIDQGYTLSTMSALIKTPLSKEENESLRY